jgi:HAD superfamily hydrolase (TIGR01490 family)
VFTVVKLAIFDVDFTLTKKETLIQFYLFMLSRKPSLIRHMPKTLKSIFLYLFKNSDLKRAKESFIAFIECVREEEMQEHVKEFYEKRLSAILYKDAIDKIKALKAEGCLVYLISASPEFYLRELYSIPEVDMVIGTVYKLHEGVHKCEMVGENCKGEEKVVRLKQVLEKEGLEVDFKNSYMFSDSLSDLPLLKLVGKPYLINYKKKHDTIEILNWK